MPKAVSYHVEWGMWDHRQSLHHPDHRQAHLWNAYMHAMAVMVEETLD